MLYIILFILAIVLFVYMIIIDNSSPYTWNDFVGWLIAITLLGIFAKIREVYKARKERKMNRPKWPWSS